MMARFVRQADSEWGRNAHDDFRIQVPVLGPNVAGANRGVPDEALILKLELSVHRILLPSLRRWEGCPYWFRQPGQYRYR
jgi:hypothetical protein